MRRALSVALSMFLLSALPASAGLGSDKTAYVGGTIPALKAGTEGTSLTQERFFQFDYPGGSYEIPYTRINDLEYGQNAGRRLGLALTISPLFLLSKKRKHFLTIGFLDEKGTQQAAIFELGKNVINLTLASLEAQTGRTVTYLDEEARKSGPKEAQARLNRSSLKVMKWRHSASKGTRLVLDLQLRHCERAQQRQRLASIGTT
jgi:hypothetical protein